MWNALYYNVNGEEIEPYNVVKKKFLFELKQKYPTFDKFEKALKSEMKYRYWSRCEWELVIYKDNEGVCIKPWVGNKDVKVKISGKEDFYNWLCDTYHTVDGEIRFDIYDQLLFEWNEFVNYCWEAVKDE